jgi:hypothetical protein
MKLKIVWLTLAVFFFTFSAVAQSVVITGKKTTYTRRKPISEYKKTFTINYPKVRAATPALSRKIEAAISYKLILGLNLQEELTDTQWLEEADYQVVYNKNGILCIDLTMSGSAAYPDGVTKTAVVDLKKGTIVKTSDVFTNLQGLAAMVRKAQKKEIADAIAEIRKDPENNETDPATLFKDADFRRKDLEGFSVNEQGVTFKYDYGFPHVIQALQPDGKFFFTWAQLRPYLVSGGLLARIAR